jgi:sigma-B regulation protein RsbU (phosphoserine phosphatase)
MQEINLLIALINSMAVLSAIAYILTRSRFYREILERRITWKNRILLVLIFGGFSIYGTLSGYKFMGALGTIRDLGPTLAGLTAGPVVGLGAGLIGAVHRYSLGGFTQLSCSLATLLAGFIGGLVYMAMKGRLVGIGVAVGVTVFVEILHGLIALAITRPLYDVWLVVKGVVPVMATVNALGAAFYIYIVRNVIKQRELEREKNAIEGELAAAREIQMSIVPKIFPPFPERSEFQLHAVLEPAKEVGGDLYDFFFVDQNHLVFLIGDVSGKGVPASLFMAVTKTLIKTRAASGIGPDEILCSVNRDLCEGNDTTMFVTVFCAVLEVDSGRIVYSSAGHNPPVLLRKTGTAEYLLFNGSTALGVFEDSLYSREIVYLSPEDTLILYTDGITEAMNPDGRFFSDERLLRSVQAIGPDTAEKTAFKIVAEVHEFAAGAPQSDDITLLALKYKGPRKKGHA